MKTRGISHLAPAAMKKPLAGGKDPGQGSTSLHEACRSGNIRAARRLLDAGADVNADDKNGWTPLHRACDKNLLAIARLLLEKGAAIDVPDNRNYTPLHLASAGGHTEVVRLLLDAGADVNARVDDGRTPLHRACTYGRVPIARLLIKHGADVNAVNGIGQDSFDLATHKGTTADGAGAPVIPILLAYGATPSEDKLERVFQTAVRMNGSNPNRGPILTWYQENRPEMYFSAFCTMEIGPGM